MEALPSKKCFNQHKPLLFDPKIRKVNHAMKKFVPRKRYGNHCKDSMKRSNLSSSVTEIKESSVAAASVEGY